MMSLNTINANRWVLLKSEKLVNMIYILLDNDRMSAEKLSKRLDVSVRTIYRYVDTLSASGIPIYVSKGRNGGISLLPEFKISKALVNEDEQINILTSLRNMRDLDVENDQTLDKLSAIFQKNPVEWLKIDPTIWSKSNTQKIILSQLRKAILDKDFISFQYLNSKNEFSNRGIYPFQVVFKKNAWYVEGYSLERQSVRLFKLTRLSNLNIESNKHLEVKGKPWLTAKKQRADSVQQIQVDLVFTENLKYRVFEEFPQEDISQIKTGEYEVITNLNEGEWLITYFLSFGKGLKVIGPKALRDKMRTEVEKILINY